MILHEHSLSVAQLLLNVLQAASSNRHCRHSGIVHRSRTVLFSRCR